MSMPAEAYFDGLARLFLDKGKEGQLLSKAVGGKENFISKFLKPLFEATEGGMDLVQLRTFLNSTDAEVIPELRKSLLAGITDSGGRNSPYNLMLNAVEPIAENPRFSPILDSLDDGSLLDEGLEELDKTTPRERGPRASTRREIRERANRPRGTTYRRSNVDFSFLDPDPDFLVTDEYLDDFERRSRSAPTPRSPGRNPRIDATGRLETPGGFRTGPALGVGASDRDKQIFDMLDSMDPAPSKPKASPVQGPAPDMGPKPLGKRMPAKLSKFAKVAGPIGAALMLYDILSTYGETSTRGARQAKSMLESAGAPMEELFTASSRNELNESSALRDIAEAGKVSPTRPSLELQGILGAQEGMLADLRQKVKPTMTEAYARAGLL
jgi:hypothetical protein